MADVECREEGEGDVTTEKQRVKELFRQWDALTEPLTTPIVYHPGGWEDIVTGELKAEVLRQRLEKLNNGGWDEATDAEVLCYLSTASLVQPLDSNWTQILLYESSLFMPHLREVLPDTPKELSDYQKYELEDLKRKIRHSQIRRRKSKKKEANMAKRKLVLEEHEDSVLVGVMQEGCDPIVKTIAGQIGDAIQAVPTLLQEAEEQWAVQPKNPTYKPPAPPKPAPKPAAAATSTAPKVEELPLLAGAEPTPAPAPEPAAVTPEPEAVTPEPAAEEEQAPEAEAEVIEAPTAPAEIEPEAEAPPAELVHAVPVEGAAEEAMEEDLSQRIAEAPPPPAAETGPSAAAKPGEWEYLLQDGRGPFESVQAALDALGMDTNNRPQHNRWDRLSTALKEKIQRRQKV